jgi:hypothetical protein
MEATESSRTISGQEPILLADLKVAMGITHDDHNSYLTRLAVSARELCEAEANTSLVKSTITLLIHDAKQWHRLPLGPVKSVTTVKTVINGTVTDTLTAGTDYYLAGDVLHISASYEAYSLQVTYVAGDYLPVSLASTTIEMLVRMWYDEPAMLGQLSQAAKNNCRKFGNKDWL